VLPVASDKEAVDNYNYHCSALAHLACHGIHHLRYAQAKDEADPSPRAQMCLQEYHRDLVTCLLSLRRWRNVQARDAVLLREANCAVKKDFAARCRPGTSVCSFPGVIM